MAASRPLPPEPVPGEEEGGIARHIPRSRFNASFLRCFAIQGSWNYRTLVGGGLAHAMLPLLRDIHAGDPVALRKSLERHASSFNGHPYLCPMAVTALARLESEGHDGRRIERFRTALAGPLGALGDRAVWAGWRPFCLLLSIVAFALGLGAWEAVLLFLLVYNMGHVALRRWAFREGWEAGLDVGKALSGSRLGGIGKALALANVVLLGAAAVLLLEPTPGAASLGAAGGGLAAVAGLLAYFFPSAGGTISVFLLAMATAAWLW